MAIHSVTLNYQGHYGYLDYNDETKEMTVFIPDEEEAAQKARDYLAQPHTQEVPNGECTYHFGPVTVDAKNSWEECKEVLTRLWFNTGVLVEWSMPPRMTNDL